MTVLKKKIKKYKGKASKSLKSFKISFSKNKNTRKFVISTSFLILLAVGFFTKSFFFAALVNGVPITRFKLISELEKTLGGDVLENLINERLIVQEARNKGITVEEAEVQSEMEKIRLAVESQGNSLEDVLGVQNQTIEDLEENIRVQKIVEKLLADKVDVTDEEIKEYFESNKEYLGGDMLYDDVKEDLKDQLKNQKLSTEYASFIEELKSESDIKYFVNF